MSSLDKQSGAADDTNIVRIVKLETQMDNVTSALTALQRTQEQNHQAMLKQFDALRDKIDEDRRYTIDRIDRVYYWMAGFTVTNIAALLGIVVRMATH
ncbi:hypothetical protein [Duganella radicis]|uniref:Uncharacterized protein n=1 Tax=Duganella radicis TaxID=551988 RepID=A0A6L6PKG5_9BURK|nr:hypothetical protein [Duganella radicis]MTV39097.1 hypothetical protein [Duganella radicis]